MEKYYLKDPLNYVTIDELDYPMRRYILEAGGTTIVIKGFPQSISSANDSQSWAILKEVITESAGATDINWYWWRGSTAKHYKWSDVGGVIPASEDVGWGGCIMGNVYDKFLGKLRTSDLTSDATPIVVTSAIFNPIAVSTSQSVSNYEGYNHYLFTTGTDDLEFEIYGSHPAYVSTLTNVRFRIQKVDDTSGTVAVTDYNGDTIATLRYQWEYVDVMYTGASDYVIM